MIAGISCDMFEIIYVDIGLMNVIKRTKFALLTPTDNCW